MQVLASRAQKGRAFYFSNQGDDNFTGTKSRPWKTIKKLNTKYLNPGDSVLFQGGQQFAGTITVDSADRGLGSRLIRFGSFGTGDARIVSGEKEGMVISHSEFVLVENLHFSGKGRKHGNTSNGVLISDSKQINLRNVYIEGYQKSGLCNFQSSDIEFFGVKAFNNGYAGISVSGYQSKKESRNIKILYCLAENNPGDPSNLKNHSGNGIVVSQCTNVLIEKCVATNNGWDMPRKGNGPVGIWAFEADSVVIQKCIAYKNKTSDGGGDGGGFDLDGGVTNSVIQYCLSYGNYGSGIGLFQYAWASNWYNNIIRNNISENDGAVTSTAAGIMIWNSSDDARQLAGCLIENNIIYNDKKPAIIYDPESKHGQFIFRNNVFVGKEDIVKGNRGTDIFEKNLLRSFSNRFNITGQTSLNEGEIMGLLRENPENVNQPVPFKNPGKVNITNPANLKRIDNYTLPSGSDLIREGFDLQAAFKNGFR